MPKVNSGRGKVRNTRSYSGMGRYPNNIDIMRKASVVHFRALIVPVAKCGLGLSSGGFMRLVRGERPLKDVIATRLAAKFGCKVGDLDWKGPLPVAQRLNQPSSRDL